MKKLLMSVAAVVLTVLGLGAVVVQPAFADDTNKMQNLDQGGGAAVGGMVGDQGTITGNNTTNAMGTFQIIVNVIIGLVGLIAVVMIIIGGISFTTSQGDAGKVTKAKNTVLYGIIGLVVAILAFAIVNFVLTNVFSGN